MVFHQFVLLGLLVPVKDHALLSRHMLKGMNSMLAVQKLGHGALAFALQIMTMKS